MSAEIVPINTFRKAIQDWWFIVITILVSAIVGWVVHLFIPPLYEARASFSISIDYAHTGRLSDIEQDQVLGIVGDIISSPEVYKQVVENAMFEKINIDFSSLENSFFLERQFYIWTMRVRHNDPKVAHRLTEFWVLNAEDVLGSAMQHAVTADALTQRAAIMVSCNQIVVYEPSPAYCNLGNLEQINSQIKEITLAIHEEQIASKGLLSGVSFIVSEKPQIPSRPVAYGSNQFILVAVFLGFFLAWWGLSIGLPVKILMGLKRD